MTNLINTDEKGKTYEDYLAQIMTCVDDIVNFVLANENDPDYERYEEFIKWSIKGYVDAIRSIPQQNLSN